MITPIELIAHGFERFDWNGGWRVEYWKSFFPDIRESWNYRIGVRYWEHKDEPCNVWLITGRAMTKLAHIDTIDKLNQLYGLLSGREV